MNDLRRWDVDFTLSLHNRTGKYFIGRDLIDALPEQFGKVSVWRVPERIAATPLARKVIGRLWAEEDRLRRKFPIAVAQQASRRPVLHLDPMTVLNWRLSARDGVLCHDLGPITHPELFDPSVTLLYERAYARIAELRPRMIFVSQTSRAAFAALYGAPASATVIYPPIRPGVEAGDHTPVDGVGPRFLLTVGSIGRRKNQQASIRAFARSGLADAGYQYVICGSREPGYADVLSEAERTPGVLILPYVSDEHLRWLYAHAQGFVLVSLLEGFGVPVAEAMRCGRVPLVSAGSVLEEVAGPMAIAVDPESVDDIAKGMAQVAALSPAELADRVAGLQARVLTFSMPAFVDAWKTFLTD